MRAVIITFAAAVTAALLLVCGLALVSTATMLLRAGLALEAVSRWRYRRSTPRPSLRGPRGRHTRSVRTAG